MKNLFKAEFKRNFKSLILWTVIVSGLALLMLLLFPTFENLYAELEALLENYPENFLNAFGLGEGGIRMDDIYGWFGVEGYLFVLLIGSVYAGLLGGGLLSKEEDDKTIEFLLSKPVTRSQIYFGKWAVVMTNLFLLNLVVSGVLLVSFIAFDEIRWTIWALYSFAPVIIQLIFASLGFLISIFVTKSRAVTSIALGLVIGLYGLDLIASLTETSEVLKYFTPYEYVNAVTIVNEQALNPIYMLISAGIILAALLSGWGFYLRKDITA